MLIKCPRCGKECEVEEEPAIGQHVLCPFCAEKFSYSGAEQNEKLVAPDSQCEENMMECACPHCGTVYDVIESENGKPAKCEVCGKAFVVEALKDEKSLEASSPTLPPGLRLVEDVGGKKLKPTAAPPATRKMSFGQKKKPSTVSFSSSKKRYCRECGSELSARAVVCPNCRASVLHSNFSGSSAPCEEVPDHLVGAIFSLFLCLPLGIVAMIYVMQSRQKLGNGDRYGAEADARTAGTLAKVAIIIGVIGFTFAIIYFFSVGWYVGTEMQRVDKYTQSIIHEANRLIYSY